MSGSSGWAVPVRLPGAELQLMGGVGKVLAAVVLVVSGGEMFCEIIRQICAPGCPVNIEMFLLYSIAYPVVPHIDCSRALLLDGVVGDAVGGGIVGTYGSGWLGVAEVVEGLS